LILLIAVVGIIALFFIWLKKRSGNHHGFHNDPTTSKYYPGLKNYQENRVNSYRKEIENPVSYQTNVPIQQKKPAPTITRNPKGHFNVYVIELDRSVMHNKKFLKRNRYMDPRKPCFYVGQTWHTPEHRFEQHISGVKSSYYPRTYGRKLRPELFTGYNPMRTRDEAERTEEELAKWLQGQGHGVWWN